MTRDLDRCHPVCKHPMAHHHYHPLPASASEREMTTYRLAIESALLSPVDIGQHSPLWDGLKTLFPDWAAAKAVAQKRDDEEIKKRKAAKAAEVMKQKEAERKRERGIAAVEKKWGGIYRGLDL